MLSNTQKGNLTFPEQKQKRSGLVVGYRKGGTLGGEEGEETAPELKNK